MSETNQRDGNVTVQVGGDVTLETKLGLPAPRERVDGEGLVAGDRVGRFMVIGELGSGGMGTVYSAYDPVLDRRIAIKVVPWRRTDDEGRRRALSEAQAMARLTHPNVVRVYDVGELGGGVFIAMELVEGLTLKQWRKRRRRSWREIVDVMTRAGAGIVAAHAAGLIHRDIKPSNILVGDDGQVLVADFGVARLESQVLPSEELDPSSEGLSSGGLSSGSDLTAPGAIVGTVAYMAPEQQLGLADMASDQYSFCLTLYEALYGARPASTPSRDGVSVGGRRAEAGAGGAAKRTPALGHPPRWLRAVLRRGLATEPSARFASMAALVGALSRGSGRRRLGLAAAVVAVPVLAGATLALATGEAAPCVNVARGKLEGVWSAAERAQLDAAFTGSGVAYAPATFAGAAVRLDRWASAWRSERTAICEATWVTHEQSEELLDRRMACLDRRLGEARELVRVLVGETDDKVIERAVQAVASLPAPGECARLVGDEAVEEPIEPALRERLARVKALRRAGKLDVGFELARTVVHDARVDDQPRFRAEALLELGMLAIENGASEDGEASLRESVRLAAATGDDVTVARAASKLVYLIGYVLDRNAEAETAAVLADAMVRRAGGALSLRSELAVAQAGAKMNGADYAAARELLGEVLEGHLAEGSPDDPQRARYLSNYGLAMYLEGGRNDEAIDYLERAVASHEAVLGPDHPAICDALTNLAMAYETGDRLAESRAVQERAIAIWEQVYGPVHRSIAAGLVNLGVVLRQQGELEGARRAFERSLAIRAQLLGPDHHRTAIPISNLGRLEAMAGRYDDALAQFRRAQAIFDASVGPNHPYPIEVLKYTANAQRDAGRHAAAAASLADALARAEAAELDDRHAIQLELSRAVWTAERDRARSEALARASRDGAQDPDLREQATAWLVELASE